MASRMPGSEASASKAEKQKRLQRSTDAIMNFQSSMAMEISSLLVGGFNPFENY